MTEGGGWLVESGGGVMGQRKKNIATITRAIYRDVHTQQETGVEGDCPLFITAMCVCVCVCHLLLQLSWLFYCLALTPHKHMNTLPTPLALTLLSSVCVRVSEWRALV